MVSSVVHTDFNDFNDSTQRQNIGIMFDPEFSLSIRISKQSFNLGGSRAVLG